MKLRGRVDIRSVAGQGTTFFLKLPLTLAIIDGLVVGVGRERYIVPLFAVREMFRPTRDMVSNACNQGEMVLVRAGCSRWCACTGASTSSRAPRTRARACFWWPRAAATSSA